MVKAKFLKILCPRCRHPQVVYGSSSIEAKCPKCNCLLLKSRGGKAKIKAPVKEVLC